MVVQRFLPGLALAILLMAAPLSRPAQAAEDATQFMNDLGSKVLHLVADKQGPEGPRKQEFTQLAVQSFDVPKIARYVLGRYWRTANDDQRQQFSEAFQTYMIQVYWSRFSAYAGVSFKVASQREEGNEIYVFSEVALPNGQPPAKVTWHLEKAGDSFKIVDASLDGISQAVTYQSEFASVIEQHGGDVAALISDLRQKANG